MTGSGDLYYRWLEGEALTNYMSLQRPSRRRRDDWVSPECSDEEGEAYSEAEDNSRPLMERHPGSSMAIAAGRREYARRTTRRCLYYAREVRRMADWFVARASEHATHDGSVSASMEARQTSHRRAIMFRDSAQAALEAIIAWAEISDAYRERLGSELPSQFWEARVAVQSTLRAIRHQLPLIRRTA